MIKGRLIKKAGTTLIWLLAGYGARQVADPWLDAVAERLPFVHDAAPPAVPYAPLSSYNASLASPVALQAPLHAPFSVKPSIEISRASAHLDAPNDLQAIQAHWQDITSLLAEARYVP